MKTWWEVRQRRISNASNLFMLQALSLKTVNAEGQKSPLISWFAYRQKDILQYRDCILFQSRSDTVGPLSTEIQAMEAEPASYGWTGHHEDSHKYWRNRQSFWLTCGVCRWCGRANMLMLLQTSVFPVSTIKYSLVVLYVLLTAGTCAAPSSCTETSGTDRRWPEPVETWCCPIAHRPDSYWPHRHAPSLTWRQKERRETDEYTDKDKQMDRGYRQVITTNNTPNWDTLKW